MAKRVLVTGAANIGKAGVATIVYKWGQQFNSNKLVYDYLMQSGLPEQCYQDAIAAKGGIIYTMEGTPGMIEIIKWVEKIVREYHYETIHINSDSAYIAAAYIYAAKKGGIKNIYVHSHCTQIDDTSKIRRTIKVLLHKLCRPYICKNTIYFLACSQLAGNWMFGKRNVQSNKYKTIYNGVEVERYFFDTDARQFYRSEFGIENKFVIANIGRLSFQKNQEFLIRVFAAYHKKNQESVLMIAGDGELKNDLVNLSKELGVSEDVVFLGQRDDVHKLLSAFDVMVMPSRFEGLPVTMVEAQMADLPCVVASTITREAMFTDPVVYVDGWNEENWIQEIEVMSKRDRSTNVIEKKESIFNIQNAAQDLEIILRG